ncbi:Alpha/Beta hydrolase protein [Lasiosphaeria hispida]|uniref:Alpha/Beta hydrolase protein n=1 Tax=Lasiosphaeria hispida TaxID=260671 RepID=A0AAJ0HLE8_9PEZI|nr:Alpha/Beta hydrolase protein [Lasiosphaeria hispida]
MGATPGLLYVTMEPRQGLSLDQFHDWYNNEHGPTRLRLPHIFPNGLRYRATDGQRPTFLADYDVTDVEYLETPTYTNLRENRTPREADTIGRVVVDRRFFDFVAAQQRPDFVPAEQLSDAEAEGLVLVNVEVSLKDGVDTAEAEKAIVDWYVEEHIPMLSKIPGWLRSRVFRTPSRIEDATTGPVKIATLHEYAKTNGLDGPEHKASMDTPRRTEVFTNYTAAKSRRTYELFYVFGPAPRELAALSTRPAAAAFTTADGRITTTPGLTPAIDAYVTTPDGLEIPYRLEGNPSPTAPTVAFSNSLLTDLSMWDPLVAILKARRPDLRLLRYDTRGRGDVPSPPVPATLDLLADDIATVLKALRIERLHALVGVSMGGATTLKFALKYPALVGKFVACDFNVASSEANTAAWKDRVQVAEGVDGMGKLAPVTVGRWFHEVSMRERGSVVEWMTAMVARNHVRGFRYGCQALWGYDLRGEMGGCEVEGLLAVGDGDGKGALVRAMEGFKGGIGASGVELKVVKNAGHLPMCEAPEGFWEAVEGFL